VSRRHDSHFLWEGELRMPVEICKFAVVSVETGDRLLAKHVASVTFCDQVSDAYSHARAPRAYTNANTLDVRGGTVGGDTALKAGCRVSSRFLIDLNIRPHRCPRVDSVSKRNEYHG